jgi:hypothetical protein
MRRGDEPELREHELDQLTEKPFKKGICLHPNAPLECGEKIIKAHTVQKSAGIKAISEDGHVLSVKDGILRQKKKDSIRPFTPARVGLHRASTFQGFCDKHDAELFRPVEVCTWLPSKENAFLLSFRAVAYEAYSKLAEQRSNEIMREVLDRGIPFENQISVQQWLVGRSVGLELGVRDSGNWKRAYDKVFLDADYSRFHFAAIEFDPLLPVVACGGLHVQYDFFGTQLQKLGKQVSNYAHVTINITASDNCSVFVLGWAGEADGPSAELVRSFLSIAEDRKADAVIRLCFEHLENTYLRESWWNELSSETRAKLFDRILSGTGAAPAGRGKNALTDDGQKLFASRPAGATGLIK